jgi:hypothetical protein
VIFGKYDGHMLEISCKLIQSPPDGDFSERFEATKMDFDGNLMSTPDDTKPWFIN